MGQKRLRVQRAYSVKYFDFNIWLVIIVVITLAELIFLLLDKTQPKKKEDKFWFTAKRKAIAYLESIFLVVELNGLYQLSVRGHPYVKRYFPEIMKWIGYIGVGLIILVVIGFVLYMYIKLNSLKYKK